MISIRKGIARAISHSIPQYFAVFLLVFVLAQDVQSQACEVGVASEPVETSKSRSYRNASQTDYASYASWQNINDGIAPDDKHISIELAPGEVTQVLTFNQFNLNIPNGSEIHGVEILMEGYAEGAIPSGLAVKLSAGGPNNANTVFAGVAWPDQDGVWRYGANWYDWGINWSPQAINSAGFGFDFQIINNEDQDLSAFLDRVSIQIHYTPPFTICEEEHACIPFYTDEDPSVTSYNWSVPNGFVALSGIQNDYIIQIGDAGASYGYYTICVAPQYTFGGGASCCRTFRYIDCSLSSIGDYVWDDKNFNGIQDAGEKGIEDVTIELYDTDFQLVATTISDNNGSYHFADIESGDYFIKIAMSDGLELTLANQGSDANDSDIDGTLGAFTTDWFFVPAGTDVDDIDIGLLDFSKINGTLWTDANGDGVRQDTEDLLDGVTVQLSDDQGMLIAETITDSDGKYYFLGLLEQGYQVDIVIPSGMEITQKDQGNDDRDSDFESSGSFTTGILTDDLELDAGFYEPVFIGDYIWIDIDRNGLQDASDNPLANADMVLVDGNGSTVAQTTTDDQGYYSFNGLIPGTYTLAFLASEDFIPTTIDAGNGDNDSRDFIGQGMGFISLAHTLMTGDSLANIDFGLQYKPSSISGVVWDDENGNGLIDASEPLVANHTVTLFLENGTEIESVQTDTDGAYSFAPLNPDNYYIVFDEQGTDSFSTGPDAHVTSSVTMGSTDIIMLGADEMSVANAGFFSQVIIGDYLWIDLNRNGIQDADDLGLAGVEISLRNSSGIVVGTSLTEADGAYQFDMLVPDTYVLDFKIDAQFIPTTFDSGNGSNDSRPFMLSGGSYTSLAIMMMSGQSNLNIDFGVQYDPSSLFGIAWDDLNADGVIDMGESGKSGIEVNLFTQSGTLVNTTTTDADGNYSFDNLNADDYYIVFESLTDQEFSVGPDADVTGAIVDGSTDAITLDAGVDIIQNAGYYTMASLGDYLWIDLDRNGLQDMTDMPLSGITVSLWEMGANIAEVITDANGYYLFDNLDPGNYTLQMTVTDELEPTDIDQGNGTNDARPLVGAGPQYSSNAINLISGENNLDQDFGFEFKSSTVMGMVWDDTNADGSFDTSELGRAGVSVELYTESGAFIASQLTDAIGFYEFDQLNPDNYYVVFEEIPDLLYSQGNDADVTSSIVTGSTDLVTIMTDQIVTLDAGYYGLASVGDFVWNDENADGIFQMTEAGMAGVTLALFDEGNMLIGQTTTDTNGEYEFDDLTPGNYYIVFALPVNFFATQPNAGMDTSLDSDITGTIASGSTDLFSLGSLEDNLDIDGGLTEVSAAVEGLTWLDVNANGIQEMDDGIIPNIPVVLYNSMGVVIKETISDADGIYRFDNVPEGDYYVKFNYTSDYEVTLADQGADDTVDSDITDANGALTTDVFTLVNMQVMSDVDGGVYQLGKIGNLTWDDYNADGLYDVSESGFSDVQVSLLDENGSQIGSTFSDANGNYLFDFLAPGNYQVQFDTIEYYEFTEVNVGSNDTIDSDIELDPVTGLGISEIFTLSSGQCIDELDAGYTFVAGADINGTVWEDDNGDGIQQLMVELPVADIKVKLFASNGDILDSTITNALGMYQFENIYPQDVYIAFEIGGAMRFTIPDAGSSDLVDSDVTESNGPGTTEIVTVNVYDDIENIDAGIYYPSIVGDYVWIDLNEDGIQDMNEVGLNGATVELRDTSGAVVAATQTGTVAGNDGFYQFSDLPPNEYLLYFMVDFPYVFSEANQGADDELDSDVLTLGMGMGMSEVFTLTSGDTRMDIDAGTFERIEFTISGLAFEDVNGDGLKDVGDIYENGIVVNLYDQSGTLLETTTTVTGPSGAPGYYAFVDLMPNIYYIEFEFPGDHATIANVGANELIDSDVTDANGDGTTDLLDYTMPGTPLVICGGYYYEGAIGDFVWNDFIPDGVQAANEEGINNITVRLFDVNTNMALDLVKTQDDSNGDPGYYLFQDLAPGEYYLRFDPGTGMLFTESNNGVDDALDSDVDDSNGFWTTPTVSLFSGDTDLSIDAGLIMEPASVGDFVWIDDNGNGIQDPTELGLNGIHVNLYTAAGVLVSEQDTQFDPITGTAGYYLFTNVQPGNYYIVFDIPAEFFATQPDQGGNSAFDSNVTEVIEPGSTSIFSLSPGENDRDVDAGLMQPSCLGGKVWNDINKNGLQDAGEPYLEDIGVELYKSPGGLFGIKKTDINGAYSFDNLDAGAYYVKFSDIPSGWVFTDMDVGNDDNIDSDATASGQTALISLAQGAGFKNLDGGIYDFALLTQEPYRIEFWPNPADQQVTHYIEAQVETALEWEFINMAGAVIKTQKEKDILEGNNRFIMDTSSLKEGMYYIRYKMRGRRIMKPLVIGRP